jgi:hypothetical protein
MEVIRNAYKVLVKSEGKRLQYLKDRGVDESILKLTIKKQSEGECVNWTHLHQHRTEHFGYMNVS